MIQGQISLGGKSFCQHGMVRHNSLTNNLLTQQTWNYTHASGRHRWGAYFQGKWFHHEWQPHQQLSKHSLSNGTNFLQSLPQPSLGVTTGSKSVSKFYCDNLAIVNSWEGKSSKHPRIMSLLCTLFLTAAKNNFTISLKHLPGEANKIADALSRKQFTRFFRVAPQAQQLPTPTHGNAQLQDLMSLALASSTQATYSSGVKHFLNFCMEHGVQPLPAGKLTLVYFAPALSRSLTTPTIKVYLSAVGSPPPSGIEGSNSSQSPTEDGASWHTMN